MKALRIIVLCYYVCSHVFRLVAMSDPSESNENINSRVIKIPFLSCKSTQDQPTTRANTIFDDPDDIQKQLDNEARDRSKHGKGKFNKRLNNLTVTPPVNQVTEEDNWSYTNPDSWKHLFPECAGYSQSPVDLPYERYGKVKNSRHMVYGNYLNVPKKLWVVNNGKTVTLYGEWDKLDRPFIYGGAANSRCYLFYSLSLRMPSEHSIGGFAYPLETQGLYISSLYNSFEEAVNASGQDKLAFLGISSLFKYSNHTQEGLSDILGASFSYGATLIKPRCMQCINPPFKKYVAYHGSLTYPPCTESVLWLVRANALHVTRNTITKLETVHFNGEPFRSGIRDRHNLNDRRVLFFI